MEHKVYKHSLEHAIANDEVALYRDSDKRNETCARGIEKAIQESNHPLRQYNYDLHTASRKVLAEYGTERVAWVLSATLQRASHDGRFSDDNKNWAHTISNLFLPHYHNISSLNIDMSFPQYSVGTHPAVLDGFVGVTRKIIAEQEHVGSREKRVDRSDR